MCVSERIERVIHKIFLWSRLENGMVGEGGYWQECSRVGNGFFKAPIPSDREENDPEMRGQGKIKIGLQKRNKTLGKLPVLLTVLSRRIRERQPELVSTFQLSLKASEFVTPNAFPVFWRPFSRLPFRATMFYSPLPAKMKS